MEIACGGEIIATHPRSYGKAEFVFNPLHYLALLEYKANALNQAAPLDGWPLADCVHRLRRLMEARMGNPGRREFVQVLRLMEDFHQHQVERAVSEARGWALRLFLRHWMPCSLIWISSRKLINMLVD